ncbi:NAD-dependent epimerase/dehydratase family protein [Calidifontibacter indicus]|uniref:NAD-dependent epimerase/dehydratase family protein n=1 Tax=Calidifontibacter indicus TaxID=419650 RepID=UPI003D75D6F3
MQILVAGGTNFIGRTIASRLSQHHSVSVMNRGSRAPADNRVRHIVADRNHPERLRELFASREAFDLVVDVSATNPAHVRGLLGGLSEQLPRAYVLISSAAVYSPGSAIPLCEGSPTTGDPVWGGYGEDKAACEELVRTSGIGEVTILRPPYVYGPDNNEDRERWLWARMAVGEPIFVPRDGQSSIQFCHVDHLASVVAAVVDGRATPGTYNVGTAASYTFDAYLALLAEVSGHPAHLVHTGQTTVPARTYFPFRDMDLVLDMSRLAGTGVSPGPDLRAGLEETWAWLTRAGVPSYAPTGQELEWTQTLLDGQ